jgi:enamine deaminase RidA (YjgF/YER057c/UK114 family)
MDYENIIMKLGLVLPPPPKPAGSYKPALIHGCTVFLSGQLARGADGSVKTGRLGSDLDVCRGQEAARCAALNVISVIRNEVGFEKFERILRVNGYVQTTPDFFEIPKVLNGASDLFLELFGEKGIHARSVAGVQSLPLNSAVELEVTIEIKG